MKVLPLHRQRIAVRVDTRLLPIVVWAIACSLLIAAFALSPVPAGDDWGIYYGSAQRILAGIPLYGQKVTFGYYYNPPWVAVLLIPLAFLPSHFGWSVLAAASLIGIVGLCRRWQMGMVRPALVLLSPPMMYTLLHGQIDALVISAMLLPREWWPLVSLTKPQVALSLALGVDRLHWGRAILVTTLALVLSVLAFGNWIGMAASQPRPFLQETHNLWLGLWPFQVPAGVALALLGLSRRDDRLLLAAPPFLSAYAATSSLLGPWLAVCSFLNEWQAALVLLSWWGAVVYRGLSHG